MDEWMVALEDVMGWTGLVERGQKQTHSEARRHPQNDTHIALLPSYVIVLTLLLATFFFFLLPPSNTLTTVFLFLKRTHTSNVVQEKSWLYVAA